MGKIYIHNKYSGLSVHVINFIVHLLFGMCATFHLLPLSVYSSVWESSDNPGKLDQQGTNDDPAEMVRCHRKSILTFYNLF